MLAAAAAAVGGQIVQGIASVQRGNAEARADQIQGQARSDELARDSQLAHIAAAESQASRTEDLLRTVGMINATIGGRGLDPNSPSGMALVGAADTSAQRDVQRIAFNAAQKIGQNDLAAHTAITMASFKAKMARNAGYVGGASSLLQAATTAYSFRGKSPAPAYTGDGNGEW